MLWNLLSNPNNRQRSKTMTELLQYSNEALARDRSVSWQKLALPRRFYPIKQDAGERTSFQFPPRPKQGTWWSTRMLTWPKAAIYNSRGIWPDPRPRNEKPCQSTLFSEQMELLQCLFSQIKQTIGSYSPSYVLAVASVAKRGNSKLSLMSQSSFGEPWIDVGA